MTKNQPTEFHGREADEFIQTLVEISVDGVNWTITYRDPKTDLQWIVDYPHGELQGGGPRRIRLISDGFRTPPDLDQKIN